MKTVIITVDREERHITPGLVIGQDLIQLSGVSGGQQLLLDVPGDIDVPVGPADGILIQGGEKFSIGDGSPQVDDNPCVKHPVKFWFNDQPVKPANAFAHAKATGAEIKRLDPNLQPGDGLLADLEGLADESIADNLRIILQKKDRFITVPCGNVGFDDLLSTQLADVAASFPDAHIEEDDGGRRYLIVPNFALPEHWSVRKATLLVLLPNGYPMAAPDMFWVEPALTLHDGRTPAGASTREVHLGKTWQRFSWHYTHGQVSWRVGLSSLMSHIRFCQVRLAQAK